MSMPEHLIRRGPARILAFFLTTLIVCSSVLVGLQPQAVYAAPSGCTVSGEAYIANVNALGLLGTKLGRSTLGGSSGVNTNLNLLAPLANLTASVVTSSSTDTSSGNTAQATSNAGINGLNLGSTINVPILGGILPIDGLEIGADTPRRLVERPRSLAR
jgi:hypothetical protein